MGFLDEIFKPFVCEVCGERHRTLAKQRACCPKPVPPPLTGPVKPIAQGEIIFVPEQSQHSPAPRRFVCQRCGEKFVGRDGLIQHYFSAHLMGKTIDRMKCTECNRPGEPRPRFFSYCEHCGGSGYEPVGVDVVDGRVVIKRYRLNIQETDILLCPKCHGDRGCEICHGSGRVSRGKLHELGFRGFIPPENFRF